MSRKKIQEEYEPDPDALCQYQELERESKTKADIVVCEKLAAYRVLLFLGQTLSESGDASKPKDWKRQFKIEYYCRRHFDDKYKYVPAPTPKMTFTKSIRKKKSQL